MKNKLYISCIVILIVLFVTGCTTENNEQIPLTTNSEKALEFYKQGDALSQKLRGEEAAFYYIKAIAEDKEFAMGYLQLALVQTTPKLVFKYLDKAKSFIENVSEGERLLILTYETGLNNKPEKQNEYFLELLNLYPKDGNVHNLYGNFLYGLPKYKASIKHLKQAIEFDPTLSQPYNMLGYAYRQIGDYEEAEKYYLQYINIIKDDPNPYDSYAELLLKKGDFEKSIEYYHKALEIQPSFFVSKIGIASNLILMEKHEEACDELASIENITKDPGALRRMHFAKAVVNVDFRNFERAIEEINANIKISKEIKDDIALGNDLINMGVIHLMNGNSDDAIKYYEKSIEYFERSNISQDLKYYVRRQLYVNAGYVAYIRNDIETLKKYKEKYETSSKNTMNLEEIRNVHALGGLAYLLEENYVDAIFELKQADQENTVLLYFIGTAYEELGDIKKAKEIYEQVAHYNALTNLNYAFIRKTAVEKLAEFN